MKKVKGMFASLLILTVLLGSIGLSYAGQPDKVERNAFDVDFTTLENPRPVID